MYIGTEEAPASYINTGLFGYVFAGWDSTSIKNVTVEGAIYEGKDSYAGGLAGYYAGTIENCFVEGTVTVVG